MKLFSYFILPIFQPHFETLILFNIIIKFHKLINSGLREADLNN